jgi:hypothetical protein
MSRRLQTVILLAGLVGIAFAVSRTVDTAQDQVLPSAPAWMVAGVLTLVAIVASARAWVALFSDLLDARASRAAVRGTFYLAQLTKYLPVGGFAQAASQLGLAPTVGIPLKRAAVAFPVSAVCAVVACTTLASGLALDTGLADWIRILALCGLLTPILLRRTLMAPVLDLARRFIRRIPGSDQLPTQRDIIVFYAWALVTIASLCGGYAILLGSLHTGANPGTVFCAFAFSWAVGFVALPIPAGVGVREAVLVGLLPGVGTAQLLAASLALRLLTIGTEVLATVGNKVAVRRYVVPPAPQAAQAPPVTTS